MKKLIFGVVMCLAATAACNKPSDDDCRKAIANMQSLLGTANLNEHGGIEQEVRSCKGGSSKEAVACAIKATTLEELRACDFMKVPAKK